MKIRRSSYPARKLESRRHESGVALIIALLSLLIISTLAAGVMMTTQSEVWTTANQRSMTQARYVAEAGLEQAAFFISNNNSTGNGWVAPTGTYALNTAYYNLKDFPVTFNPTGSYTTSCAVTPANCAIMTASSSTGASIAGISGTYGTIDSGTNTRFSTLIGTNSFSAQPGNPSYAVAVQLLSAYLDPTAGWITRWKIISQATVGAGSAMPAKVQVVATMQNKIVSAPGGGQTAVPAFTYGAWANSTACGAITMSGGSGTDSWNSVSNGGAANPTIARANGNIGTLGNVSLHNSAMVDGSISAPNYNLGDPNAKTNGTSNYYPYGVSGGPTWPYWNAPSATPEACSATWPYAVNMDNSGSNGFGCTSTNASTCVDKASKLPTGSAAYPSAAMPAGAPATNNTAACNSNAGCNGGYAAGTMVFTPSNTSYGQVNLASSDTFSFSAGTYYFDTLTVTASASIVLTSGPVVIYILNGANSSEPINFTGGSKTNQGGNPNNLTFVYNGAKEVHVGSISNNAVFATFYAPNANVTFDGNGNIYGAVIGNTVNITGGGFINYDTNLATQTPNVYTTGGPSNTASPFHMDEFSWSAF